MKTKFILLALLLLPVMANAQSSMTTLNEERFSNSNTDTQAFLQVGPSFSTLGYYQAGENTSSRKSVDVAIEMNIPMNHYLEFVTGAGYVQKGIQKNGTDFTAYFNANYLELPFAAKAHYEITDVGTLTFMAGGFVSRLLSQSQFVVYSATNDSTTLGGTSYNSGQGFASGFDFGARAGIGFERPLTSKVTASLDLDYDHGLKSINEDGVSTRCWTLNFGLGMAI